MAIKVLVPLLGEGVEEVTVIKWLKKEGDSVDELEPEKRDGASTTRVLDDLAVFGQVLTP